MVGWERAKEEVEEEEAFQCYPPAFGVAEPAGEAEGKGSG